MVPMTAEPHARPAELLREHGVQVTAQRLAVLRAVSDTPHGTADEVAEAVRAEIGAISRQSVYDGLGVLVDKGLLRRIQPGGSPARYEQRVGETVDVDCAAEAAPCLHAPDAGGFQIDEAEVIFWGRCPTCQEAPGPG